MFLRAQPLLIITDSLLCSREKNPLNFLKIKMDNFYGPLNVRLTGFNCNYNETYDTIVDLGKIGGREGRYKRGKGFPAKLSKH